MLILHPVTIEKKHSMIKAVMLDMGGVIVDLDIAASREAYRTELGFERIGEFLDPCHQQGFFNDLEEGKLDEQQFLQAMKPYCRPGITMEMVRACLHKLLVGIPAGKAEYLKDLATRYPLYLLSNNNCIAMPRCEEIFREAGIPVETLFKDVFVSYRMKLIKPGEAIYRESVRRTGLDAGEILFIDDSQSNVDAARSTGIKAAFYERGTDLGALIESLLD